MAAQFVISGHGIQEVPHEKPVMLGGHKRVVGQLVSTFLEEPPSILLALTVARFPVLFSLVPVLQPPDLAS